MKIVFYGIVGLIVLAVVVIGGYAYYLANSEVDFHNPKTVENFKKTYSSNCVATYRKWLTKAGTAPTEEQLVAAEAACNCARDPMAAALAKRPIMTVAELAGTMSSDPEIIAIAKSCSVAAGLVAPQ